MGTKRVGMARVKSLINENVNQIKIYTTAVFVLYLLSPSMWLRPVKWVQFAILDQFRHPNDVQTVVNGVKVTASDTGPFYLLIWLYSKLPIFFIISFFIYLFYFFYRRSTNIFSSFSLFFLTYVQIIFMLLKPPAYDGIRHYLFLIPFIIALSCDILNIYFDRFNNFFHYSALPKTLILEIPPSG